MPAHTIERSEIQVISPSHEPIKYGVRRSKFILEKNDPARVAELAARGIHALSRVEATGILVPRKDADLFIVPGEESQPTYVFKLNPGGEIDSKVLWETRLSFPLSAHQAERLAEAFGTQDRPPFTLDWVRSKRTHLIGGVNGDTLRGVEARFDEYQRDSNILSAYWDPTTPGRVLNP